MIEIYKVSCSSKPCSIIIPKFNDEDLSIGLDDLIYHKYFTPGYIDFSRVSPMIILYPFLKKKARERGRFLPSFSVNREILPNEIQNLSFFKKTDSKSSIMPSITSSLLLDHEYCKKICEFSDNSISTGCDFISDILLFYQPVFNHTYYDLLKEDLILSWIKKYRPEEEFKHYCKKLRLFKESDYKFREDFIKGNMYIRGYLL